MRVAVYTIAKNEAQFVQRWADSARDADLLVIGDTGSTDDTIEEALLHGVNVESINIAPFRFDDARNALLARLPLDIDLCIALDMDEVLAPGWREALEQVPTDTTRVRYTYTWSWKPDGTPGLQYSGDKIHSRIGYRWKHPVHEVVHCFSGKEISNQSELEIHHHPDASKSRAQYLPLLEMAVAEQPKDDRNRFYLGRELFNVGRLEEAAKHFKKHLKLSQWNAEKSASMRYLAQIEPDRTAYWLSLAITVYNCRENHCALAQHYHDQQKWEYCLLQACNALRIGVKPLEYLCDEAAWSWYPYDLAAVASFRLGEFEAAVQYGKKACELAPWDSRLAANLVEYQKQHAG